MDIRPIHTKADYKAALKAVSVLVDADPKRGTPNGDRLEILGTLLEAYEADHYPLKIKSGMRPVHPGEILLEDYIKPMGISVRALSLALHVPYSRLREIVDGNRGMSADTALRLERYFGSEAQGWLNLQSAYELRLAQKAPCPLKTNDNSIKTGADRAQKK